MQTDDECDDDEYDDGGNLLRSIAEGNEDDGDEEGGHGSSIVPVSPVLFPRIVGSAVLNHGNDSSFRAASLIGGMMANRMADAAQLMPLWLCQRYLC